jgi:hypothetical protein
MDVFGKKYVYLKSLHKSFCARDLLKYYLILESLFLIHIVDNRMPGKPGIITILIK